MKFLYTSDLHGKINLYQELIQWVLNKEINNLILGGDLLPQLGPNNESIQNQIRFIRNELTNYLQTITTHGKTSIYLICGNNEWNVTLPHFLELEKENLCQVINQKMIILDENYHIIGYPFVPPTPFPFKDYEKLDKRDDPIYNNARHPSISKNNKIRSILVERFFHGRTTIQEDLAHFTTDLSKTIIVMHSPPRNTSLDQLYNNNHAGSQAILEFIQKKQPLLSLHGHIHESPRVSGSYFQKIGQSLVINPGQVEQQLSAVLFNIKSVEETLFHTQYGKTLSIS